MDIKFENPQMETLAGAVRSKALCWLVFDPPPYSKCKTQEIRSAVKGALDSGGFTDRREMRIAQLADVMRKREFKAFRTVLTESAPRIEFGELRIQVI